VALNWKNVTTGATAVNVMHFHGASVDPTGLNTAINAAVTTAMWGGLGTDSSVVQLTITPLDGTSATQIFTQSGSKWAGANGPGDYVPAVAGVISLRTAKRGPRYRGRIYIPFLQESVISGGRISASLTAAQAAWDAFRAAMNTASWPMHIATYGHSLHRTKTPGGGYVLTPVTWTADSTVVTAAVYEAALGTQRRRQTRLR
jgi:hypothetical protein